MADWSVLSSSGGGASAAFIAGEVGKYILDNGSDKRPLYWAGAGVNVSVPGLPASAALSTPAHWSAAGKVHFSKLAPCRINPRYPPDNVFRGNGLIIEMGVNSALTKILGLEPLIRNLARSAGIQDWENQATGQMLLFNTTTNLFGLVVGIGLADILGMLMELATTGDYSSIYTQGIAFVASTSTGIDTAGITVTQGMWVLW